MDCYDARLESFKKGRRVKTKNTSALIKWPHPSTYAATPEQLAEAGFYFDPTPTHRDNVVCFMCEKELDEWDEDDDPLIVHFAHCRDSCPWAVARCGNAEDLNENGSFAFKDPARVPTSKAMEKARADTFLSGWPHDFVKGHGANSKKMAKAGFLYAPHAPGDDTAICVYCTTTLSGWDADDDPLEEHRKRVMKSGRRCVFFETLEGSNKLSQSSRAALKPAASRSTSQSQLKKKVIEVDAVPDDPSSDEELLVVTKTGRTKRSTSNRASSVPAKTPASRKSTRSAGTSGRAPSTRGAAASETEEDLEASGTETGKRVSKSKRKGPTKTKEKIEVIEEENEETENVAVEVEPTAQKPKRGRPPGKTKASKKTPVARDVSPDISEVLEVVPPPKKPGRARSKTGQENDSEAMPPPKLAASQSKPKSSVKPKKSTPVVEVLLNPTPAMTRSESSKSKPIAEESENDSHAAPPKFKGKGKNLTASKAKAIEIESEDEDVQPHNLKSALSNPNEKFQSKNRKRSSTSDDAGYATAEQPMEVEYAPEIATQLQTEVLPPRQEKLLFRPTAGVVEAAPKRLSDASVDRKDPPRSNARDSGLARSTDFAAFRSYSKPASSDSSKQQKRVSSRPQGSFARPPSRIGPEIVDVSSDDDDDVDELDSLSIIPPAESHFVRHVRDQSRSARNSVDKLDDVSQTAQENNKRGSLDLKFVSKVVHKPTAPPAPTRGWIRTAPDKPREGVSNTTDVRIQSPKPLFLAMASRVEMAAAVPKPPSSSSTTRQKLSQQRPAVDIQEDIEMAEEEGIDRTRAKSASSQPKRAETVVKPVERVSSPIAPPPQSSSITSSSVPAQAPSVVASHPPLPSFDEEFASEKVKARSQADLAIDAFTPFLSLVPIDKLTSLTEEEGNMTLEQYIRYEIDRQYQQFKEDGERRIAQFKQRATEARKMIEDL